MSEEPISVPEQEQTPEQKEEQEKQFAQADLLKEVLGQLKPQSASVLQTAKSLQSGGSKDDLNSLADSISQLASAARNAQGRLDSGGLPNDSYSYKAIRDLSDYADMAHNSAKGAADATGDNDEVRGTNFSNLLMYLEHGDGPLQGA